MAILDNPQWEKAAQVFVETGNKTEAYRQAGYSTNMSDKAISANVNRLFHRDLVLNRVAELQAGHKKRHDITIDSLTERLTTAEQLGLEIKNPAAAVSAIMGIAKMHGLLIDKKQLGGDPDNPLPVSFNLLPVDVSADD